MNKRELIDRVYAGRAEWEGLLAEVGEVDMLRANAVGIWSIRDLILHIGVWERWAAVIAEFTCVASTPTYADLFGVDLPPEVDVMAYDAFNEWMVVQRHRVPLAEVISSEDRLYQRFVAASQALEEADLLAVAIDYPGKPFKDTTPLWELMAEQSYRHYRLHAIDVRRWMAS